jgi:exodeoxyribonuclease V gamma subunit
MPGGDTTMFGGALPYDDVEGSEAALAGKLADLIDALSSARKLVSGVRTVPEWRDALSSLLARGVDDEGPRAVEHESVRDALAAVAAAAARGGFEATTPLAPIVEALERTLEETAAPHGFLSGGITFCALLPLRSIPFRVVCLVGMNDDAFPRASRPPSFDLVAAKPRRGDRSVRDDDRYLFLEAILSARERLVITHVGQSARDGTPVPPSVVVGELLDVMAESFRVPGDERESAVRARLVHRHPMQPFSPRYFREGGEGGLFSYARVHERGAAALSGERVRRPPFFTRTLGAGPAPVSVSVDLDELSRFFAAPLRGLLHARLSLSLGDDAIDLDDREPITVDGLARFALGSDIAAASLEGRDVPSMMPLARAAGRLPLGTPGERAFDDIAQEAIAFAERVRPRLEGGRRPPLRVDVELDGIRVTGLLRDLYPLAQVHHRFARLSGRGLLRVWIHHLALLVVRGPSDPDTSVMVPRVGDPVVLGAVDDPRGELARLVALYVRGQHEPLPFFPDASLVYVTSRAKGDSPDDALLDARRAFAPNEHQGGHEGEDAYIRRALALRDPFLGDFRLVPDGPTTEQLAEDVLGPLVKARRAS